MRQRLGESDLVVQGKGLDDDSHSRIGSGDSFTR
jgi:hypothetical protein